MSHWRSSRRINKSYNSSINDREFSSWRSDEDDQSTRSDNRSIYSLRSTEARSITNLSVETTLSNPKSSMRGLYPEESISSKKEMNKLSNAKWRRNKNSYVSSSSEIQSVSSLRSPSRILSSKVTCISFSLFIKK